MIPSIQPAVCMQHERHQDTDRDYIGFQCAGPDNSGALPGDPTHTSLTGLVSGYGAECRNGTLWTTTPKGEAFQLTLFAGGNLHMHDMDLFYEDIRMNAVERVEAFLAQ